MIAMIKKSFPSFNQVNQGSRHKENEARGNSLGARTSCPQKRGRIGISIYAESKRNEALIAGLTKKQLFHR